MCGKRTHTVEMENKHEHLAGSAVIKEGFGKRMREMENNLVIFITLFSDC
jgi:hypothetical protein